MNQQTYINTWRVCQTRVDKSLIRNNLPDTLFLSLDLFGGIILNPQTSKTSESTASLSVAERWTITEICSDLSPAADRCPSIKTRTRERELIKPYFQAKKNELYVKNEREIAKNSSF